MRRFVVVGSAKSRRSAAVLSVSVGGFAGRRGVGTATAAAAAGGGSRGGGGCGGGTGLLRSFGLRATDGIIPVMQAQAHTAGGRNVLVFNQRATMGSKPIMPGRQKSAGPQEQRHPPQPQQQQKRQHGPRGPQPQPQRQQQKPFVPHQHQHQASARPPSTGSSVPAQPVRSVAAATGQVSEVERKVDVKRAMLNAIGGTTSPTKRARNRTATAPTTMSSSTSNPLTIETQSSLLEGQEGSSLGGELEALAETFSSPGGTYHDEQEGREVQEESNEGEEGEEDADCADLLTEVDEELQAAADEHRKRKGGGAATGYDNSDSHRKHQEEAEEEDQAAAHLEADVIGGSLKSTRLGHGHKKTPVE